MNIPEMLFKLLLASIIVWLTGLMARLLGYRKIGEEMIPVFIISAAIIIAARQQ